MFIVSDQKKKRNPREKFVELANKRVNRAIKDLRLVGNLSNIRIYKYSEEDVKKILKTLQKEMDFLKTRFRGDSENEDSIFIL